MQIEGVPSKRFGVSYGGKVVGSYDTAQEAWDEYRKHDELIRPAIDPKKKYRYSFRDGRKEISIEQLRNAGKAKK